MTSAQKRKKKLKLEAVKKKLEPVGKNLGGAAVGTIVGAYAPKQLSAYGGATLFLLGSYSEKDWMASTGLAMLVATAVSPVNQRQALGGKTDLKTMHYNGKERLKSFLKAFGDKFVFWKKKDKHPAMDEEDLAGLGTLDAAHFAALDELSHQLVAQGLQLAAQNPSTAGGNASASPIYIY